MTRVLYVGPYQFPSAFDSLETADYIYRDFYEALSPFVEETWVLTGQPVPPGIAAVFASMDRLRLAGPRYSAGGAISKVLRDFLFYRFGRRLIREQSIDVVTNIGSEFSIGSVAAAIGRRAGVRTVIRVSGDEMQSAANEGRYRGLGRLRRPIDERRRKFALNNADAVIAMSDPEATRIGKLGIDPEHIVVCPRGVDVERFHPPESRARTPIKVLYFGRFHGSKGFDIALGIARVLESKQGIEMTFAGGDRPADAPKAQFLGAVAPREMPQLLRETHIVVFPSRHEGLPQGMLEAMASGCACIMSTDVYQDLVPQTTGVFCPLDPPAFVEAVVHLAADEQLRNQVGHAAHLFIQAKYDRRSLQGRYVSAVLGQNREKRLDV